MARADTVRFPGRLLFLTEDPAGITRQLQGHAHAPDPAPDGEGAGLRDNISTDEITPGWVCYYYDETLAEYCLVGLRGGVIQKGDVKNGGFSVVVSGRSKGCGSSRETAPYSELKAGVGLVLARSIEKIYGQNAQNIGLLTSTDFGLLPRIQRGEAIPLEEFTRGLDPISADIVRAGGLFEYSKARMRGEARPPVVTTLPRPMTLSEKILARHCLTDLSRDTVGVPALAPGDALFVRADVRFSHEYVTPMADALFRGAFGEDARVTEPGSVYTFRDHLTFLDDIMPEAHVKMGLRDVARRLAVVQEDFAKVQGVKHYGEVENQVGRGSHAICHNAVLEDIALPGQVVAGTDSHTCMAGALGCFAFGVGSTDMAAAWYTRDVRVKVPETVKVHLRGALGPWVSAKDVMLHLLSQPFFRDGRGIGKVLEFTGPGAFGLPLDERATLTNMSVEAGGFTGILEADEVVVDYLVRRRGLDPEAVRARVVRADPDATYAYAFDLDLAALVPMVATPGDPRNGLPLGDLGRDVKIDIAYGGSCTGGKKADMDMYARVLSQAHARGQRVAPGVQLYLQFGSQDIRRYAEEKGYVAVFEAVGAQLINPSCGACIKAGPGVSGRPDEVTVSAINRNFPGRSGPGQVYLASPYVVAASALAGRIVAPAA
ncbi:MAG: 3-isopropylmalate dehydratase [Deltaproteobacteria bacterium]|nr:3-isopropylmalate dehydratase [Deltaproteobacteria bacterium]